MPPYVFVPLVACIVSAATALALCARDPFSRRSWPLAGVSAFASVWAFCEVAWNLSTSEQSAVFWMRAGSLGWVPIGPVVLLALAVAADADSKRLRKWVVGLLILGVPWIAVTLLTPLVISSAVRTSWGWSTVYEPLVLVVNLFAAGCVCTGLWINLRQPVLNGRHQSHPFIRWLEFGLPLTVVTVTDVLLPFAGYHAVPRLGTLSLAALGVMYSYSLIHYGESELIPEGLNGAVLERMPDGLVYISVSGHVRAANRRFAELVGLDPRDLVGRRFSEFLSEPLTEPLRELREEECLLTGKGLADVAVSVSAHFRLDTLGKVTGLVVVVRDLGAFMAVRNRVLVSGRMAAVGELASGIAHELNNPLSYVSSNTSQIRVRLDELLKLIEADEPITEISAVVEDCLDILAESLEGLERTKSIVRDVLEFSQTPSEHEILTDPAELVEQTLRVGRSLIQEGVTVTCESAEVPQIHCVPLRIKQAILCLLSNASQAVDADGTIEIETTVESHSLVISVSDDGCGITPEQLDRIFDPFYSTQPVGVGTGLGLTIAFRIACDHEGSIRVSSEPGRGSRFEIHLPLARMVR